MANMAHQWLIFLTVVICTSETVNAVIPANSTWITNERKLYHDLMDKYEKTVRPVAHEKDSLHVRFSMVLNNFDLDEERQELKSNVWFRYSWTDIQLQWNPENYGGVSSINIDIERLWTPDVVLYNAYDDNYDVAYRSLAVITNDGTLLYVPPAHLSTFCAIDLTKFPFDTQVCLLKFGSWTYNELQVNLTWYGPETIENVDTSNYQGHNAFELSSAVAKRNKKVYACCPESYIDLLYTLTLERKPTYATHMFLAPSVVLCFILPAIFLLPPESKEKINFGVGLLLSNGLILTMIAALLPSAHPTVPAIGVYHMTNMILIALSMGISSLVMNIWAKGDRGKKLPKFVQQVVLRVFGKVFCVSRQDFMPPNNNSTRSVPSTTMRSLEVLADEQDQGEMQEDGRDQLFKNFQYNTQRSEWHQLAVIVDRLCFIVYIMLVIVTTLALATR